MRLFGGEKISQLMTTLKMPEDVPLEHGMVTKAIEQAQVKVESFHFDSRKHLVEYDDVMNKQREIIYKRRRQILDAADKKEKSEELKNKMLKILQAEIELMVNLHVNPVTKEADAEAVANELVMIIPFDPGSQKRIKEQLEKNKNHEEINKLLIDMVRKTYDQREKQVGNGIMREVEKFVMLTTIDKLWMDHLDAIDDLREGIGLRGYAQRDPLVEYKAEAFTSFEKLMGAIDYEIARKIFRVQVSQRPPEPQPQPEVKEVHPEAPEKPKQDISGFAAAFAKAGSAASSPAEPPTAPTGPTGRDPVGSEGRKRKIGRNDPCWCGKTNENGKPVKWKKCHYPQQAS